MSDILLKDLIYIKKGVLTSEQCDDLILERESRNSEQEGEHCLHSITGKDTYSTFKQVQLIPDTQNFNIVKDACQATINEWTEELEKKKYFDVHALKKSINFSHMYRLMRYEAGGWIHPHIDWTHGVVGSLSIALNDNFKGGEFKFFNGQHSITLEKGDAVIFPANPFFIHEVTEVTEGRRYSVNSFLTSLPHEDVVYFQDYWNSVLDLPNVKDNPMRYNLTS
jgi:predicted 2-oxoglutarate/Fe(II)-dependent dioxygenase YbiX|tara:strand:+ start:309 stop:977 length:669 start_codon:yes stop_codon:yes gene_type:complete